MMFFRDKIKYLIIIGAGVIVLTTGFLYWYFAQHKKDAIPEETVTQTETEAETDFTDETPEEDKWVDADEVPSDFDDKSPDSELDVEVEEVDEKKDDDILSLLDKDVSDISDSEDPDAVLDLGDSTEESTAVIDPSSYAENNNSDNSDSTTKPAIYDDVYEEKPVIYLYGYDNANVEVSLNYGGNITCTYPRMNSGDKWSVMAQKDGTLKIGDKKYDYLFWEGASDTKYDFSEGYCVKGSKTEGFLDESLTMLGLTDKEKNDFIVYWLPRMQNNPYNIISFQGAAYTSTAKINVNPAPKNVIRVFMAYYPSDTEVDIKNQTLQTGPSREEDTTLVEWGGAQVDPETFMSKGSVSSGDIDTDALVEKIAELSQDELQNVLNAAVEKKKENGEDVGGHEFTDKTGAKHTFTDKEWSFLQNTWMYTGQPDAVIAQFTVNELLTYLSNNYKE